MSKIIFKIDKNQDAKNWQRVTNMVNLPHGLINVKNNQKKIKNFSAEEMKRLEKNKQRLEKYFKKNGSVIFLSIEKLTKKPIYTNTFHVSFTTAGLMPYDISDSWFMIPAEKSTKKQITVIIHELYHLQVAHYYMKYCLMKGLSQKQFSELNEIVTFILTVSMLHKLNLPKDKSYPKHKKLIKELQRFWIKDKNFEKLLDKSISTIKLSNL